MCAVLNNYVFIILLGFGGFGATSSSGGGLFGSQAKPAFSFGGTSTANTGFGGLGTNTGGGLFSNTSKPGGLFGGGGTGFGTGTSTFGATNTGGFGGGGGLNFGATAAAPAATGAAPAAANSAVQQQLLMALQSRLVCKAYSQFLLASF